MNNFIRNVLPCLAFILLFTGCRKNAWDEKYNRPETLEPPIYQVLEERGNFKSLTALIQKGGYAETLDGAGYWTMFAPNDEAFDQYFKELGIAGVNAIDSGAARAMVQYWLVYNAFEEDRLDDYQATANNAGWTPSIAFRRRTAYYTGFYKDTGLSNRSVVAVASNRNNVASSLTGNYVAQDDNNKYITYFTKDFMSASNLSASDYNYFYPNSEYTGFNVAEAKVVNKNIMAENGVIHEVDKVITPLMSIDEYIRTKPQYSTFRALLNRLYTNNMVQFIYNADMTRRYQVLTGKNDSVFVKAYSSLLSFSPNNENHLKVEEHDGQKDCWTIFIPDNEAVDAYIKEVLCANYPSLDQMPIDIIADFLNSHLFATAVWPSKFSVTRNKFSEPARFDPFADIIERKILSNGILYGTNKVQEPDVFRTVYSKAYLHPGYSMMTRLLNVSGLRLLIAKSNVPVNLFLIPDQVFAEAGYSYNVSKDQFEYKPAGGSSTTNGVYDRLVRIAKTCVFFEYSKQLTESLSGEGIVKSGDAGVEGDYIIFEDNKVFTAGLLDAGKYAVVDSSKIAANGKVYFLSELPIHTEKPVGFHIKNLGLDKSSPYNHFWEYLSKAVFFNATTNDIAGLTGFSTVFVPTNEAILQAVNDGLLPGTGTAPNKTPNFNPSDVAGKEQVRKFLQYHMMYAHTVVPDGSLEPNTVFETYLKDDEGTAIRVTLNNAVDNSNRTTVSLLDNYNRTKPGTDKQYAQIMVQASNNLSNRCVIHLIDKYLNYNIY